MPLETGNTEAACEWAQTDKAAIRRFVSTGARIRICHKIIPNTVVRGNWSIFPTYSSCCLFFSSPRQSKSSSEEEVRIHRTARTKTREEIAKIVWIGQDETENDSSEELGFEETERFSWSRLDIQYAKIVSGTDLLPCTSRGTRLITKLDGHPDDIADLLLGQ